MGMKNVQTVLKFTVTGAVISFLIGWLLSLVSGNIFVVVFFGALGTLVSVIVGVIHRNDP